MFPASSLIFVVILAVWAVYLVQHWVRRRDHVATARSVDRFSESMRVLERRRALPRPDLSEPAPRSYSVSPLRPARPEVVVKHVASRTAPQRRPGGATPLARPRALALAKNTARLRLGLLALGSAIMLALVLLSMLKIVEPWGALIGVGIFGLAVAAVRVSAMLASPRPTATRASAPARSSAAPQSRAVAAPVAGHATSTATRTASVPASAAGERSVAAHGPATRTARRSVRAVELYDLEQVDRTTTAVEPSSAARAKVTASATATQPESAQEREQEPGTWHPVPVPPPTYTLKAAAYRTPAPTGSHLPSDGTVMALEEEFEDLPRIESVG